MKQLTKTKSLEVANICYANVSSLFATFSNPKMRGPNFKWENFARICEDEAWTWVWLNAVKGDETTLEYHARKFAREIAETLVARSKGTTE